MKYIPFILSVILTLNSKAQDDVPYNKASSIPPSPTSAALGKYGDVPVGLYTGVPNISIPLYTASEGNLSIPVSLSYHSQGIKVADEASWVGLGWSLNAGGTITRAIKGAPDDFNGDLWGNNYINGGVGGSIGFLSSGSTIENLCTGATPLSDYYMNMTGSNTYDGEPDLFYFNFPGGSGQFVFDKNGSVQLFSQSNLKFNYYKNATADIIKFEIIDGNGNTYTFDEVEKSRAINCSSDVLYQANYGETETEELYAAMDFSIFDYQDYYNSSWHLTQIKNATGNHQVNFSYTTEYQKNITGLSKQYKYKQTDNSRETSYTVLSITAKRLSQITWSKGSIVLNALTDREDLNGLIAFSGQTGSYTIPAANAKALSDIQIKDITGALIKKYTFNYSYFQAPNNTICLYKKLKLLSVTEQSSDLATTNPPYSFEYDETVAMAPKFSQRQDFWGYLKISTAPNNLYRPLIYDYPNDPIDNDFLSEFSIYPRASGTPVVLGNYDKSPEPAAMKFGIIKKITYPTKGSTTFEFEPHDFYIQNQTRVGGGLRIKRIIDFDGMDHDNDMIKNYSYKQSGNPTMTSGKVLALPIFAKRGACVINNNIYNLILFNNSIAGLGSTLGSHVGYTEVTVEYNGNGKTLSKFYMPAAIGVNQDECTGGNCLYNRSISSLYLSGSFAGSTPQVTTCFKDNFPFTENPNYDWNRGALLEEHIYDNQSRIIKKTVNEYTIKSTQKVYAFANSVVRRSLGVNGSGMPDNSFVYKYVKHYYLSAWKVLSRQTVTKYDVSNSASQFSSKTNYNYDNATHKQLTKITVTDSKGQTNETILKRCLDYITPTGFLATLSTQNRLNEVIEKQAWIYNYGSTTSKKLLGTSFTEYKDFAPLTGSPASQLLPAKIYGFETSSPVPESGFIATGFSGSNFTLDSRYKAQTEMNYDNKDNLNKQSIYNAGLKNHSTNIFGYDKTLLIAKVNNASETDCGFTSFESDDQNLWTIPAGFTLVSNNGHCGTASRIAPPNSQGLSRIFVPSAETQNKKFILSCWVKTTSAAAGTVGNLGMYTVQNAGSTTLYPNVAGAGVTVPIPNTNNVWKYIEVEMDLNVVKGNAGLPAATALGINSFVANTQGSVSIQVDDIRFYPKEARMASYTYLPLIGATSVSDENSNCNYYEYDSFGRLKLVRDQNGRILEKTEYNYKP